MLNTVKNFFLELFFPSFCFGCNTEGSLLCYDCKSTLDISQYNYCLCSKNTLRLPFDPAQGKPIGKCPRCQDRKLSGLYFALPYKEKQLTRKLIHNFKYEPYIKSLAGPLSEIMLEHFFLAQNLETSIWENAVIIPVPLEIKRWKNRGYNQSQELGQLIGQSLNVPLISNNLVKIRKTKPQMKLSAIERQENLRGAFKVKNPTEIAGKKIFLIDDVYTTGATMEECAKTLKASGAKSVWGIAITRDS